MKKIRRTIIIFLLGWLVSIFSASSTSAFAAGGAIRHFYAENMSLIRGESTAIYWRVENAARVELWGFGRKLHDVPLPLEGALMSTPPHDYSYELKAFGFDNSMIDYQLFTVIVKDEIPVMTLHHFTAAVYEIDPGGTTSLYWKAGGFKTLSIEDRTTGTLYPYLNFEGALTVYPLQTTTYILHAVDRNNMAAEIPLTVTVRAPVLPAPTLEYFQLSNPTVAGGESIALSWRISGYCASVFLIDQTTGQTFGPLNQEGQLFFNPLQTTRYTLQVTDAQGQTYSSDLWVQVFLPNPVIENFSADRAEIFAGEVVTLAWRTQGAMDLALVDGATGQADFSIPFEGYIHLSPQQTTTYTLKALGGNGNIIDAFYTVIVRPQPVSSRPAGNHCLASASARSSAAVHGGSGSAVSQAIALSRCGVAIATAESRVHGMSAVASAVARVTGWKRH
jgi:hypothetical protein